MKKILIISRYKDNFKLIRSCFEENLALTQVGTIEAALESLKKKRMDYIFVDLELLGESGVSNYRNALQPFWKLYSSIEIILITPQEKIQQAVMAVKAGAGNYLISPINPEEIIYVLETSYEYRLMKTELDYLRDQFWQDEFLDMVRTDNNLMKDAYEKVRSVAPTKSTVLLLGETGTGKGIFAKLIHRHSNRNKERFINVHCGSIPDTLVESELFGHEKGAFTGATHRKLGKFELSKNGTIFLDEIATLSHPAQIKLLQVLQDGTFNRIGSGDEHQANTRVIAATNQDLKTMCEKNEFRKDLYYRINVFPIELPPLRKRSEDIPRLSAIFLNKLNKLNGKEIHEIHPYVIESFLHYPWPGNIRELENVIERAYILTTSPTLTPEVFPKEIFEDQKRVTTNNVNTGNTLAKVRNAGIEQVEKNFLNKVLLENKGRIDKSAEAADITTRQLHKLMKKYGFKKENFK